MPQELALPSPLVTALVVAAALLGLIVVLAIRRRRQPLLRSADAVLGPIERDWFARLQDAVAADYLLWPHLPAAHVLAPRRRLRRGRRRVVAEDLAEHHFAFVVCDGRDTRPLAAIELHDPGARDRHRRRREREISAFCADAGLPLLWLHEADDAEPDTLRERLDALIAPPEEPDASTVTADGRREPRIDLPDDPGEPVR